MGFDPTFFSISPGRFLVWPFFPQNENKARSTNIEIRNNIKIQSLKIQNKNKPKKKWKRGSKEARKLGKNKY